MEEQSALKNRVIEVARKKFLTQGYSKVSMSEIAAELNISKKTLYREFADKEDLLREVIFPVMQESARITDGILSDPVIPFLEKLRRVMSNIGLQKTRVTEVLLKDIYT